MNNDDVIEKGMAMVMLKLTNNEVVIGKVKSDKGEMNILPERPAFPRHLNLFKAAGVVTIMQEEVGQDGVMTLRQQFMLSSPQGADDRYGRRVGITLKIPLSSIVYYLEGEEIDGNIAAEYRRFLNPVIAVEAPKKVITN